ncbi:hypothetical protein M9458_037774, partial [Cirrhinus mrigala]
MCYIVMRSGFMNNFSNNFRIDDLHLKGFCLRVSRLWTFSVQDCEMDPSPFFSLQGGPGQQGKERKGKERKVHDMWP